MKRKVLIILFVSLANFLFMKILLDNLSSREQLDTTVNATLNFTRGNVKRFLKGKLKFQAEKGNFTIDQQECVAEVLNFSVYNPYWWQNIGCRLKDLNINIFCNKIDQVLNMEALSNSANWAKLNFVYSLANKVYCATDLGFEFVPRSHSEIICMKQYLNILAENLMLFIFVTSQRNCWNSI